MGRFAVPLLLAASILVAAALIELGTRAVFAFKVGPSIFAYGTNLNRAGSDQTGLSDNPRALRWDARLAHKNDPNMVTFETEVGTYSKYRRGTRRPMFLAGGGRYEVRINRRGFRGANFGRAKAPGTVRVVTLGTSSTFGYLARDDETYPHYLERRLNDELGRRSCRGIESFEVLNLGIPHLDSREIHALFVAEAIKLAPDVVSFYSAANDTRSIARNPMQRGLISRVYDPLTGLGEYSLAVRYAQFLFNSYVETFSASDLTRHLEGKVESYLSQLDAIADEARRRGILFIPISQQAQSQTLTGRQLNAASYDTEVQLILRVLERGQRIGVLELQLLIHAQLTAALREWVADRDLPFVDFIAELERRGMRSRLITWVHLHPEANRVLAEILGEAILAAFCDGATAPAGSGT